MCITEVYYQSWGAHASYYSYTEDEWCYVWMTTYAEVSCQTQVQQRAVWGSSEAQPVYNTPGAHAEPGTEADVWAHSISLKKIEPFKKRVLPLLPFKFEPQLSADTSAASCFSPPYHCGPTGDLLHWGRSRSRTQQGDQHCLHDQHRCVTSQPVREKDYQ